MAAANFGWSKGMGSKTRAAYYLSRKRRLRNLTAVAMSGAATLAGSEPNALALDFTDDFFAETGHYGSAYILDTTTPANNYNSHPYGKLTYTSPSAKMTRQADGTWKFNAHNLILQSEDFSNASWTKTSSATATADTVTDGNAAAFSDVRQVVSTVTGATYTFAARVQKDSVPRTTRVVTLRVSSVSNFEIQLDTSDGSFSANGTTISDASVTDTGSHWQVAFSFVVGGTSASIIIFPAVGSGATLPVTAVATSTGSVTLSRIQFYRAPAASLYLATTTTARYALPFEWSDAGVLEGILVEEARTNSLIESRDLTKSNWTKSNATAAYTATGIGGSANQASTLTATAANAWAYQTLTHASAARSSSVFLRRRTGTGSITITQGNTTGSELVTNGTFGTDITGWTAYGTSLPTLSHTGSAILITNTGTTTNRGAYQTITTVSGKMYRVSAQCTGSGSTTPVVAAGSSAGAGDRLSAAISAAGAVYVGYFVANATTTYLSLRDNGTDAASTLTWDNISVLECAETTTTLTSSWQRFKIENQTLTNSILGVKLATSGDAIDVDCAQNEAGAFVTSPIPTRTATVTRAVDNINLSTSAFPYANNAAGTIVLEVKPVFLNLGTYCATISDGTNNNSYAFYQASAARIDGLSFVGAAVQAQINPGAASNGTTTKRAFAFDTNDFAASADGGAVGTDTSGSLFSGATLLRFARGDGLTPANSYIRKFLYVPRRMTNTELQTRSA